MSGEQKTFVGGPFDGYPVEDEDEDYLIHDFDFTPGRLAVYWQVVDEHGTTSFLFRGMTSVDDRFVEDQQKQARKQKTADQKGL